jgi:hypothetical protein
MPPPWKLVVEDLGRIGRAEVEARPLLLFVGGNNTGKTYLASLLWGLLSLNAGVPVTQGDAYRRSVRWIEERFARREQEPAFTITPEVHADFVQIVNDTLHEQGATFAERTFNRPGFNVGKIELSEVALRAPPVTWKALEEFLNAWSSASFPVFPDYWRALPEDARHATIVELLAKSRVWGPVGPRVLFAGRSPDQSHFGPVFLPASRTGFMLLYRSLAQQIVRGALDKTGPARPPAPDLTTPAADFIDLLMSLRPDSNGAFPDEAAFLERAIGGPFSLRSNMGLNEVLYEHTDGAPALPMQLSSSLVTELAPVVLTLRHVGGYQVLIIEEPEAHLHPRLQRILAQVIVRLVRKGIFVWITTHSENFCQQINNFMKLGAHPRRAEMQHKYGYEESDYLEPDDVGGYQFELDASGTRTVVTEMTKTPQGLVMPTFNRELAALTDQAMDLEQTESGE